MSPNHAIIHVFIYVQGKIYPQIKTHSKVVIIFFKSLELYLERIYTFL